MSKTLQYILEKFKPELARRGGTQIRNINRTIVAQSFGELGFTKGAEVGVAEGVYAKILLDNIPGLKLYCVDIWEKHPGYDEYSNIEAVYGEARERLKDYDCQIIKKFSMEAVTDFPDNSLDFVFIDAAHDFKNVACDIAEWSKKVRPGGVVFGHDYKYHQAFLQEIPGDKPKHRYAIEVKPVVDAYCNAKGISPWFVLYPEIVDPTFGPDNPCWMFVRTEEQPV